MVTEQWEASLGYRETLFQKHRQRWHFLSQFSVPSILSDLTNSIRNCSTVQPPQEALPLSPESLGTVGPHSTLGRFSVLGLLGSPVTLISSASVLLIIFNGKHTGISCPWLPHLQPATPSLPSPTNRKCHRACWESFQNVQHMMSDL